MKRLLTVFIMVLIAVFIGNAYAPDDLDDFYDKWHDGIKLDGSIRLDVSNNDKDPIISTIKGYLLAELRKIPDVDVVSEDESWLIKIVPMELDTHIVLSICYLDPHDLKSLINLLSQHNNGDEDYQKTLKTVELTTDNLYRFIGHEVLYFPKHKLQEKCREIIVGFDADHLQPVRENVEQVRKRIKDFKKKANESDKR